jgi:uncharacterized DUF497 family protein
MAIKLQILKAIADLPERPPLTRLISARRATGAERRSYEEKG